MILNNELVDESEKVKLLVYLNEILLVTESKVNVHPEPILLAHSLING